MSVNNTRPNTRPCWAHDTCDICGRDTCPDCITTCHCPQEPRP